MENRTRFSTTVVTALVRFLVIKAVLRVPFNQPKRNSKK